MVKLDINEIGKIEETTGSSFYTLNLDVFRQNYTRFLDALTSEYSNASIGYSYKTNFIPALCLKANELGAYAEIVSPMELEIARRLNVHADRIIYNGPIKDFDSLYYCLKNGSKVNIDNNTELNTILSILEKYPDLKVKIGIRLNLDLEDGNFSRFGYDVMSEEFDEMLDIVQQANRITVSGLHFHATRRNKSLSSYTKRLTAIVDVQSKFEIFNNIEYIDVGGGFYGPMHDSIRSQFDDYIPTFEEYGHEIGSAMKRLFPSESLELILEPGLSLTVNTMDFYTKVYNIKHVGNKKVVTVEGSFHNVKPSGHKRNLTLEIVNDGEREGLTVNEYYLVCGYTCLENDILYEGEFLGSIKQGDYLKFLNVGAYTIVFKPPFIRLAPPILEISDGSLTEVRKSETFDDIFAAYNFL